MKTKKAKSKPGKLKMAQKAAKAPGINLYFPRLGGAGSSTPAKAEDSPIPHPLGLGPRDPDGRQTPRPETSKRLGRAYTAAPDSIAGGFTPQAGQPQEPTPPRKGKAYTFIKTDKGLFPFDVLRKAEIAKDTAKASKQIRDEKKYMTENGLVPLPFEVEGLLTLLENCSYYDAACRQIANDVVGQGYDLILRDGIDAENKKEREATEAFLDEPTEDDDDTIEDVIEKCLTDWNAIGWLCFEISRGDSGLVTGLYHVPSHTIRVHKDGKKYCQIRGQEKRWFKKFGLEEDVNAKSGEPWKDTDPEDDKANELLFRRRYYARSSYYGIPPIFPGIGSVQANIGIRDYNLAFFSNYGVPAAIVTVKGEWDEESVQQISNFIDVEIKGSNNAHKTVVLNPPEGGEVTWEPLVVEVKEGHFKLYAKQLRDDILVCYKMPPYRIGIAEEGALGGSVAREATKIYVGSTVNPQKWMTARLLNRKILKKGRGVVDYEFWWNDLDIRDMNDVVDRCVKLFGAGSMNRNEVREEVGREHLVDEEGGDKYYLLNSYVPIEEGGLNPGNPGGPEGPGVGGAATLAELQASLNKAVANFKEAEEKYAQHGLHDRARDDDSNES